jgi:cell pole-organizing protein PopZ
MSQPAKVQEPSMEEILASIRRIIADDDGKAAKAPSAAPAKPAPPPPPPPPPLVANTQDDVDAMLADLEPAKEPPPSPSPPVAAKSEPAPPPPAPEPEPAPAEVLVLTEEMAAEAESAPQQSNGFRTIEGASDVVFSEAPSERDTADTGDQLLSNTTAAAVDKAFNSLAHTILGNNARTLEDLVKDMLRPMLKAWLDDNLPGLVERIVRAEIERVSRGR